MTTAPKYLDSAGALSHLTRSVLCDMVLAVDATTGLWAPAPGLSPRKVGVCDAGYVSAFALPCVGVVGGRRFVRGSGERCARGNAGVCHSDDGSYGLDGDGELSCCERRGHIAECLVGSFGSRDVVDGVDRDGVGLRDAAPVYRGLGVIAVSQADTDAELGGLDESA